MNKLAKLTYLITTAILLGHTALSATIEAEYLSITATSLSTSYTNFVSDVTIRTRAISENVYQNGWIADAAFVNGDASYNLGGRQSFNIRIKSGYRYGLPPLPDEIEITSRQFPDTVSLFFQFPSGTLSGTSFGAGLGVLQNSPLQNANYAQLRFNDILTEDLTSFSIAIVPEPSSIPLVVLGFLSLLSRRRRPNP
ncbi:MAG: PEP-CTERM sorting domain-containing protein [Verrucomicrobiota bacterium]